MESRSWGKGYSIKNVQLGQVLWIVCSSVSGFGEAAGVEAREPSAEMYQVLFPEAKQIVLNSHVGAC